MSIPVSYCLVSKATSDPDAYKSLLSIMRVNVKFGAFTILPCVHDPACPRVTKEQVAELDRRILAEIGNDYFTGPRATPATPPPSPDLDSTRGGGMEA